MGEIKELIKIKTNEEGKQLVSARELHEFLEIRTPFPKWIVRMLEYGFVENQDYLVTDIFVHNSKGGKQTQIDYAITIDMGKELSMIQRTDKGKQARQYFIQCEKKLISMQPKIPTYAEALRQLADSIEENEKLKVENGQQKQLIGEMKPKVEYVDTILKSKDTVTVTQIAKDYGMSAQELNKILNEEKIQYCQRGQWLLYARYQDKGYTKSNTVTYKHGDGSVGSKLNTRWTQKGRLFINDILRKNGIVALMDREYEQVN